MNANDSRSRWRFKLHEVIFEADTPAGKWFDVLLIVSILVSVVLVMLDSVSAIQKTYGQILLAGEWLFTILFTIEYLLRLLSVGRPLAYATSFFGVVDLLAILPTYLSYLYSGRPVFSDYPVIAGSANFSNFKTGAVSGRGPFTDAGIASQST